jgi:hypothetical protein
MSMSTGPGRPLTAMAEGLGDDVQEVAGLAHEEIVLGDGDAHAVGVHFLKGVGADHGPGNLAGDADHGHGIELGVGDGGEDVGRAGAGGGETDGRAARDPGHALGQKARALFMAGQDVADARAAGKGVVEGEVCAAGDARDGADALAFQKANGQLRAGHGKHRALLFQLVCRPAGGELKKENPRRRLRWRG